MKPRSIMIFAAGHGTRMGELTRFRPKPMIEVGNIALIDRALALADAAGISHQVVNTHYLGQQIAAHLRSRPSVVISHEGARALETGGGLKNALPRIKGETAFTLNPDAVWTGQNPLTALMHGWNNAEMDALLMLVPLTSATGHKGRGDFSLGPDGRLSRFRPGDPAPLVNTGAQIIRTAPVATFDETCFSLNVVWDRLIETRRLFGMVHPGGWADVGTPAGIAAAETLIRGTGDV